MDITADNASSRFYQHLAALTTDTLPPPNALWQNIILHYREPHRAYHNLSHIAQLLTQFDRIEYVLDAPHMVALAIYYHDIIYDPQRSDNEAKSAEYADEQLAHLLSDVQRKRLKSLIMMTAAHEQTEPDDMDAAYLLDMDLSILGADWHTYAAYADAVRKEYAHVTTPDYRAGRTRVLAGLLAKPRLYLTQTYQALEAPARANIKREQQLLASA